MNEFTIKKFNPTTPRITIGIPTYNRANIWKTRILWNSLLTQTERDFETIIVDDNSTDDTIETILQLQKDSPLNNLKFYKTILPKKSDVQASAVADNIIFGNCTTGILIHLDDDGWVSPLLVEKTNGLNIEQEPRVFYLVINFNDPQNLQSIGKDSRLKGYPKRGYFYLKKELCWGAAYIAPTELLKTLGGFSVLTSHIRGSDTRLGVRLFETQPCLYYNDENFVFNHLGKSFIQQMPREEYKKVSLSPNHHNIEVPIISNGGWFFFESEEFKSSFIQIPT